MTNIAQQEIEEKVKKGLSKVLGDKAESAAGDQRLIEDIGIDSFASIELLFELEEEFGIKIPDEDFTKLVTVNDVVIYIKGLDTSKK